MNVWDYVIIGVVATIAAVAVFVIVRRKKRGGCSAGCGCCPERDRCEKNNERTR
ncbi:MAG: FeoB-associated Cys-rich membrane protein [Clostridia bacterium]|nr:FeoB-associated Cys-rich membrane protein [Clostridia bacterium]